MHSKWIRQAAVALLFTGITATAWAQQDQPREAVEEAAETAATPGAETGDAPDSGDPARPQPGQSPFEYESSEQISEDLSVSFPVDI